MLVDVHCAQCARQFRVPDQYVGKRIKCPKCQAVIEVAAAGAEPAEAVVEQPAPAPVPEAVAAQPAPEAAPQPMAVAPAAEFAPLAAPVEAPAEAILPQPSGELAPAEPVPVAAAAPAAPEAALEPIAGAPPQWRLRIDEGQEFGPVTKEELDAWVADERVDASCQLLCEGWEGWKLAAEVYPQLAAAEAETPAGVADEVAVEAVAVAEPAAPHHDDGEMDALAALHETIRPATRRDEAADAAIPPAVRETFKEMRRWVKLMALLGLFVGGMGVLVGLFSLALAVSKQMWAKLLIGPAILIGPALWGVGSYYLLRYEKRIRAFTSGNKAQDLESLVAGELSFWKLAGILMGTGLACYFLLLFGFWLIGK